MDTEKIIEQISELATQYGIKVIGAIVIWIVGSWIIKRVLKLVRKAMSKSNYEESLQRFLANLLGWVLKLLLILAILANLGIETTSFAAVLAAAGLAVGMALQGSLGNFAGGVMILIFKPFKIGDVIEAQGELGTVKEIDIFTTKVLKPTNRLAIIPNGALSNGNIINYTAEGTLQIRHTIGVSYDSDIKQTKDLLLKVMQETDLVLKDPAPSVTLGALADSSVNFNAWCWCDTADYWTVYFSVLERIKIALDEAGIEIPYPHQVEIQKQG
ncbi:mechanosensitive ion channel protein [Gilvibacter sp. SZ-19]|uniref:mechanosensitive ion channel family protein n=1 Tax=unclassified Gilvibacter TaxID=2625242 RepID=UPI000B3C35A9|nr:mechanosensitive ion channel domain-containing protein [Gilvibacter sp. SZ-19]ARV13312.1 mechanosensitive ion channel protein [Gilvibacter sp. SZ-19]